MSTYIWLLLSKVYLWYLSVSCVTIHFFLYVSQCIICIYHTLPTLLLLNILFFSQFAIIMNKAATFYTCILLLNLHLWAKLLNHKIHVHAGTWASWLTGLSKRLSHFLSRSQCTGLSAVPHRHLVSPEFWTVVILAAMWWHITVVLFAFPWWLILNIFPYVSEPLEYVSWEAFSLFFFWIL